MLILALESSAKAASCALLKDGKLFDERFRCDGLTHSETLLPMAEEMMKSNNLTMKDVDLIAVAHGPGSFTGIRIGVSTVKGLAWAADKKCVGVSTLEAMAFNGVPYGGIVCCCMDARRQQVYNALFEIKDGRPVRLCADRAISLEDLIKEIKLLPSEVMILGDGAEITAKAFEEAGVPYRAAPDEAVMQRASGVAKAAEGLEGYSSQDLLPVYLRLSQAERERQARLFADK